MQSSYSCWSLFYASIISLAVLTLPDPPLALSQLLPVQELPLVQETPPAQEITLTIGSQAPSLAIEHWMSDGEGKFPHTTDLVPGKVYVVEFWATWCGPCIRSMPFLSETQQTFADKNVQIISVSDEPLEEVKPFLERKVIDDEDQTYGELTKNYCLTCDPDGSVLADYFDASGQVGIPVAFIVGKDGLIEWIGHPRAMEEALEQVVNDKWDRAAFLAKYQKKREDEAKLAAIEPLVYDALALAEEKIEAGEAEQALKIIDALIADKEFELVKTQLEGFRSEILILHVGGDAGVAALKKFVTHNKNDPEILNHIAWAVYESSMQSDIDQRLVASATEAAEMAVKLAPEDGFIIDTLAHLIHVSGDLDRALELQEKAMTLVDGETEELEPFLQQLHAEKAQQAKKTEPKEKTETNETKSQ